jgi:hypothetical protein
LKRFRFMHRKVRFMARSAASYAVKRASQNPRANVIMYLMYLMDKMDKSLLRGIRLQCNLICGILFSGSNYLSGPAGRQSRFFY